MTQHSKRRFRAPALRALTLAAGAIAFCPDTDAAIRSWMNASGGSFNATANWSAASIPGAADSAVFDLTDPGYVVSFNTDPTNLRLTVADDVVTFDLNAHTYNLTSTGTTASLIVGSALRGNSAVGRLTILDGTVNGIDGKIADAGLLASAATLTVGNGGRLILQSLLIGAGRPGTFSIQSGGQATTSFQASVGADTTGRALISGAGATWQISSALDIGVGATGQMDVSAGGVVSGSLSLATVGYFSGISGTANVTGVNSKWSMRNLVVGGSGSGALNVSGGGSVGVTGAGSFMTIVGESFGGSGVVTVDGATSRLAALELRIGNFGQGQLHITGGGSVSSLTSHIGYTGLGAGTVSLSGAGSSWSTSNLYVGGGTSTAGGPGLLSVGPGTTFQSQFGKLTIWSTGTVDLNGGTIQTGSLQIASGGHFNWNSGLLWLTNQTVGVGPTGLFGNNLAIGTGRRFWGSELRIGQGGVGSMSASDGGEVLMSNVYVGDNAAGLLSVSDTGTNWTGYAMTVGRLSDGNVNVSGGASFTTSGSFTDPVVIGDTAAATGTVVVDGVGTVWNNSGSAGSPSYFHIGRSGNGNVTISNGASFINGATYGTLGNLLGSHGSLSLQSGATMSLEYELYVGDVGNGSLAISGGSDLTNGATHIGRAETSVGVASVDGAGSSWTTSGVFTVGHFGSGVLRITDAANVTAGESYIGLSLGSTGAATISGTGSTWNNNGSFGYLIVGGASHGSLTIEEGGSVMAKETFIGDGFTGVGTVVIDGAGSSFVNTTELSVGYFGHGSLLISGGSVTTDEGFIAAQSGSTGYVLVQGFGSTWTSAKSLDVGFGGTGLLVVNDHGLVNVGSTLTVGPSGQVQFNGGTINTSTLALNGGGSMILSPGGDKVVRVNQLVVDAPGGSKLDLADNDLIIDYTGATPIASIKTLIATARGGGSWNGNGITSSSANATSLALGYGDNTVLGLTSFAGQTVDATSVFVKFTYYGDADLNGQVDVVDLGELATNWQSTADWTGGDFDYNGTVNVNDLGLLASNWQAGVGSPLGPSFAEALASFGLPSVAVPEPSELGLVLAVALKCHRRRRHT